MSKTERALDHDAVALDELDDFVATEAAEADRAIDELIGDAVAPRNGNATDAADEVISSNGFDTAELELPPDAEAIDAADDPMVETTDDAFETGELDLSEMPDTLVDLDGSEEIETDAFELVHLESLVETDEGGVVDDEVPEPAYELPAIVPATVDEPDEDDEDDDAAFNAAPVAAAVTGAVAAVTAPVAKEGQDEVSDDILEELRRADIDGPIVDLAPQDDTTSARRRPKRRADYDPAPVPIPARPPRILGRKPRVRKVTRVVRHVDPWSVFKIAAMAFMVLYVIALTAGVLLWNVAYATGTVDNVERFFESFGWSSFEFNGGEIYHSAWIMGLFAVIGLTGMAVLAATLFNLITDIVGGIRFTVLEEEVVETRTSPMRRFVVRRPEPEIPAVTRDASGAMIRDAVVDDSGAIER